MVPSPRWTPKTLHFFLIGVSALVFRCFQPDLFWIEALREPPPFDQGFRDQGSGIPKALLIMKSGDPTYLVLAQRNPTSLLRNIGENLMRLGARAFDGS